jgi:hypothetical protein
MAERKSNMKTQLMKLFFSTLAMLALVVGGATSAKAQDPLPSWNDGPAKQAIVEFVSKTTTVGSPDFVPPEERIATFDQDGTLWVEHPVYSQLMFCLDRIPAIVVAKPELKNVEPFKTVQAGDGPRLAMLVLHDDAKREYAYGPAQGLPDTKVGTFTQALYDEATKNGWTVISMKNDWKRIFAFEQ